MVEVTVLNINGNVNVRPLTVESCAGNEESLALKGDNRIITGAEESTACKVYALGVAVNKRRALLLTENGEGLAGTYFK